MCVLCVCVRVCVVRVGMGNSVYLHVWIQVCILAFTYLCIGLCEVYNEDFD